MTTINPIESPVQIVGKSCIEGAKEAASGIVVKRADRPDTVSENGTGQKRNSDGASRFIETQQTGNFYLPEGFTRTCDHCGREYTAKRNTSRFCRQQCRINHHRATREAGGGRAGVFLMLAALVVVIWYFWPFLMDVAAQRPRLPDQAPAQPTAVIWPTMAPAQPDQAPTAVPAIPQIIIIPDPGQAPTAVPIITLPTAEPLPIIAPTAVPATFTPAAGNLPPAGQGGDTFTLTTGEIVPIATAEFYATCAYNQAAGRRARPDCPPNAAALLGGGR